jgi:hypothetical protein
MEDTKSNALAVVTLERVKMAASIATNTSPPTSAAVYCPEQSSNWSEIDLIPKKGEDLKTVLDGRLKKMVAHDAYCQCIAHWKEFIFDQIPTKAGSILRPTELSFAFLLSGCGMVIRYIVGSSSSSDLFNGTYYRHTLIPFPKSVYYSTDNPDFWKYRKEIVPTHLNRLEELQTIIRKGYNVSVIALKRIQTDEELKTRELPYELLFVTSCPPT